MEQEVYLGEMPIMMGGGEFIINGAERVIVSQLHRSPGICFETSQHLNGKMLHSFRIIPDRGSWLEVQFDTNDLLYVYLDRRRRRRKFLATTFLRVLGYPTDRDIVSHFYSIENLALNSKIDEAELGHKVPFEDILDGELVIAKAYEPLTAGIVKQLVELGQKKLEVIDGREDEILLKSLRKDPAKDEESALKDIYRKLRPGDPPTASNARALLKRLFFDAKKYDLTRVGRYKINQKLGIGVDSDQRIDGGQRVERAGAGSDLGLLRRHLRAHLAAVGQVAGLQRKLAGGVHQVAGTHRWNIGGQRLRHRGQGNAEFGQPFRGRHLGLLR